MLLHEATADLRLEECTVQTPLPTPRATISKRMLTALISGRAGHGRWFPRDDPGAQVWHLGIYRDEKTLRPVSIQ